MRKITNNAAAAFIANRNFNTSNTTVTTDNNEVQLYLHGNKIAWTDNGKLYITDCGWQTNVTKERLNALPNVDIRQKNFCWYLNGKLWGGNPVCVETFNK